MEIKEYSEKFLNSFIYLIDNSFGIKNNNKIGLIKWKFFSNPNNNKNKIICSYFNNKIVGQYSNIATSFTYKKENINGYTCQDMCVLKEFRGKGLISKMSKYLYSNIKEDSFSIGFSNKFGVKVDQNSKGYGYTVIDKLISYILPTFLSFNKNYNFKKIKNLDELKNINFSNFDIFDNYIKINSSFDYIKWRYFNKPNSNYNFFLIYDEKENILGYIILTFKKGFGNIYDFNSIKTINNKKMIYTFKKISIANNVFFLRIQVLKNNFWKFFFKGFLKINKNEDIYFTIKKHNEFQKVNIIDKENWIIKTGNIL